MKLYCVMLLCCFMLSSCYLQSIHDQQLQGVQQTHRELKEQLRRNLPNK